MNSITQDDINRIVAHTKFESTKMGKKTAVMVATLPNGYEIVESSSCVDPANYSQELGNEICMKRIIDRIWALEGYVLQNSVK